MSILEEIHNLEIKIDMLPKGTLVYKKINGVNQPYLQQTINGKSVSAYIKKEDREKVLKELIIRNDLLHKLKELKSQVFYRRVKMVEEDKIETDSLLYKKFQFKNTVLFGKDLMNYVLPIKQYKKRECFKDIEDYLYGDVYSKVFILYGLRRTGKTTLIKQAILNMSDNEFAKTAFIQIVPTNTLAELNKDLILLREFGYKYVFIDEITMMDDFIEGSALLSDVYAAGGMKIVLSGTDSLGFWLSEDSQLYDRTIMVHTTYIPYGEFENVLGIKGIDNYICYGGTMSVEGKNYNKVNKDNINQYIDSSIAKNIQHSLKNYQHGGHFRHLGELYEKKELTNVINRVVEDTNHRFTMDVLTNDFVSHDLGISANNLRRDINNGITLLDDIDKAQFTNNLKTALDIINKNEQIVQIEDSHREEIEEYLCALDLIQYINIETFPSSEVKEHLTVLTQPGIRYAQAKILIQELLLDKAFDGISDSLKKQVSERILSEIRGRMMEEIVLLETTLKRTDKKVFKLLFKRGEFDMVVEDIDNATCEIYEIKHSDKQIEEQYKNLIDIDNCKKTEEKYGKIIGKYVIYRGEKTILENGVTYLNVEDYLNHLSCYENL